MATLKVAVIGLGYFGKTLVQELAKAGAEVLAIDSDMGIVEEVRDVATVAVRMDATDRRLLKAHNVDKMNAVVVTIGHDFESLVMTIQELLLMGVERIYARASSPSHRLILDRMGVAQVVSPEEDAGRRLAQRLTNPGLVDYLDVSGDYRIVEIECPPRLVGKTIGEVEFRRVYNINLITLRRLAPDGTTTLVGVPTPDLALESTDTLILLSTPKDIQRLTEQNR